jgi:hypothetical protein
MLSNTIAAIFRYKNRWRKSISNARKCWLVGQLVGSIKMVARDIDVYLDPKIAQHTIGT